MASAFGSLADWAGSSGVRVLGSHAPLGGG